MNQEIWKGVPDYPNLEASSFGRVRFHAVVKAASLTGKYAKVGRGYLATRVNKKLLKVHRLVAFAFIGAPPNPKAEVNHKDGNTTNNRPENLEWTTSSGNQLHAIRTGLRIPLKGEEVETAKLTAEDVLAIRASSLPSRAASPVFGISPTQIKRIRANAAWKHL